MKVTAFLPPPPKPAQCPRCFTLVRSDAPLNRQHRKRIVIEIFESPGTGNVANARHIWNVLKTSFTVHILVSGNEQAVQQIFNGNYERASPQGVYDLLIVPGVELRLNGQIKTRLTQAPPLIMVLPPPFAGHLFGQPCLLRGTRREKSHLDLPGSVPFLPFTQNWRQITPTDDYQGLKQKHFPQKNKSDVFFIVTYLGLASKTTDAFKDCEEQIIILNFGKHRLEPLGGGGRVVSINCDRLPMNEFEECLRRCTTLYPAVTDGANTVGTIQSLELPYYDLSMQRVLNCSEVAFLNEGNCNMGLFKTLGSRQKNAGAFEKVLSATRSYYEANPALRQRGRGAMILDLVKQALK